MSVTVTEGIDNPKAFLKMMGLEGATRRSIRHAWFELGKDLRAEANREILRKPKSGRVYVVRGRGGRRRRHVASAPGETHANLTGKLRRSIGWKVSGSDQMDFGYGVASTGRNAAPPYAPAIEFGRADGSIAPRPSLQNAIRATQRRVPVEFEDQMERETE